MPLAYIYTITLKGVKPKISATVAMNPSDTFYRLHEEICNVMGWYDYHLHEFRIGKYVIGDTRAEFTDLSEHDATLYDFRGVNIQYEYDFGDGWVHDIVFKGAQEVDRCGVMEYPKGKPIEDCGGPYMYSYIVHVLATPEHEQYETYYKRYGNLEEATGFKPEDLTPKKRKTAPSNKKGKKSPAKKKPQETSGVGIEGEAVQLKYYVKGIKPMISRTVVIPRSIPLSHLHKIICITMGWNMDKPHEFIFRNEVIKDEKSQSFSSLLADDYVYHIDNGYVFKFRIMSEPKINIISMVKQAGELPDSLKTPAYEFAVFHKFMSSGSQLGEIMKDAFSSMPSTDKDCVNSKLQEFAKDPDGYGETSKE